MSDELKTDGFNLEDYQIKRGPEKKTITIEDTGASFEVTVKEMSWSKRNQLISKCMKFDSKGNTSFQAAWKLVLPLESNFIHFEISIW